METLLAYAFDHFVGPEKAAAGVRRIETYYGRLWQGQAKRDGCDAGTVGLHTWSRREPDYRWPAWRDDDDLCIASLHVPLGYQTIVGDLAPQRAAAPLARAVLANPARMVELAPPFVLSVLDPADERLELFTDSVGVGRLFQLRTADGWVWSSRPVAACLFADVPVAAADRGWQYAAGCGWFMGDTTPYDRVLAVPGATRIVTEGRRNRRTVTRIDATSIWSGPSGGELSPGLVEETAETLRGVARSVSTLWPGTPTVDLSGGRDSRVVAAAFLSAGVDLRLNSYDAVPGELGVAEQLVKALPYKVDHRVTTPRKPSAPAPVPEVVERIRRWHRYGEGLRPASYLFHTPPDGLANVSHLAIGGAGGEVAHGHFYPRDVLTVDQSPLEKKVEAFTTRLHTRLVPVAGPTPAVREAVTGQIQQVFREAIQGGFENAKMLDYFYVVERLRRWGTAGERTGVVSPLLVPAFFRGAFSLTAPQRLANEFHRALVRELVPQWAEIPFFVPGPAQPHPPAQVKRLSEAPDRELVAQLLMAGSGDFDATEIEQLWESSLAGRSTAADEVALRQLLWRAVFDDHLAEVNQHLTRPPVPTAPPPRPTAPKPKRAPRRSPLKTRLRRNPTVRRLARTRAWRAVRKTLRPH
ncbi:hypothetical protein [Kribbella sp. CA-293567]|uniref:hypothetical protein n=1 Tax=Kribbella sp. CA-293567 TaxID=3002436 RepID=UPI0022DD4754|nr:hypothetical protein [Kribbella sp. CA-293567]WBQ06612.1 hypothetical protein OX958_07400 [Kribbella sp. CA-293567]